MQLVRATEETTTRHLLSYPSLRGVTALYILPPPQMDDPQAHVQNAATPRTVDGFRTGAGNVSGTQHDVFRPSLSEDAGQDDHEGCAAFCGSKGDPRASDLRYEGFLQDPARKAADVL